MTIRPGNKPLYPATDDPQPFTDGQFRYASRCTCGCTWFAPRDAATLALEVPKEGTK